MHVTSVNVGLPREVVWKGRRVSTGIYKEPVAGRVRVRTLNLDGDRQADLTVHGGAEKAVYLYPAEHYPFWQQELPDMALPWGVFGENVTTTGLHEATLCIGDRLQIGSTELVVTQPRMPCYKLGIRFGRDDILKRFLASERSGFYCAVTQEGDIAANDPITILDRDPHEVSVTDIVRLYVHRTDDPALLRRVVGVAAALPEAMARLFRAATRQAEQVMLMKDGRQTIREPRHAPLIGITTHPATDPHRANLDVLLDGIVRAVERTGGLPVLIPPSLSDATVEQVAQRLDGLLISGGGDIDPGAYGMEWHPALGGVDARRDQLEFGLIRQALRGQTPIFGICRGAQALNVAMGGTLYRTIDEHPGAQRHQFYPGLPFDDRPHAVQIAEDSRLSHIIGAPVLWVNSLHHQACRRIAPGVRVTATAPDGVVEAIEVPDHRFAVAVQWHPEALPDVPEMQSLFAAFVEASRSRP